MPTLGLFKRKKKDKTSSRWKIEAPWESSSKRSGNESNGNGNQEEASTSLTTSLTAESLKQSTASASSVSSVPSTTSVPAHAKKAAAPNTTATVHPEQMALVSSHLNMSAPYQSNINNIINPPGEDDSTNGKKNNNNNQPIKPLHPEQAQAQTPAQNGGQAMGYQSQPQSNMGTPIDQSSASSEQGQVVQAAQTTVQTQVRTESRSTRGRYALSDFVIQRTLGTGSFGRVHLVQSRHNLRFYAIKVLKKAQVVRMKQVEHTNDERRMLQKVRHPFLVTLWGTFQDCRNLYMVMDFIEGGELFSLLRKSQRFPNPVAKFYAAEVALALDYLHGEGIIYRDLKPENLLLDRHGHLKITDFGFAKEVPDITWTLCGTPDYLAPEVVTMKGYNKSVDWWSLGILIFEMLCGYTPFYDAGSPMRIYENIKKGTVKYPHYINPDALDLLQQLITPDLTKRLGNLRAGSNDIKHHKWFQEVNWERLVRREIEAPYIPPVKGGVGDASQFDRYPEEQEEYGIDDGTDPYGHLFENF